jgi:hypothetical protein
MTSLASLLLPWDPEQLSLNRGLPRIFKMRPSGLGGLWTNIYKSCCGKKIKKERMQKFVVPMPFLKSLEGVAIFLSILLAFAAYIYTRRWKALMVFLGWCFFLGVLFSDDEGEVSLPGLFLASTWAAVDNCGAIQRAREEIERLRSGQNPDVDRQT